MPKATIYHGSKGPTVIADMPYPHSKNARDKLARMGDPARADELEALDEHVKAQEASYAAEHPEG